MKPVISILLVSAGGVLGALARYGLSFLNRSAALPAGTLLVNLAGCFVIGLLGRWLDRGVVPAEFRLFLGVGFLGALTTFSTFSYEALLFFHNNNALGGLLYIVGTTAGCLLMVTAGYEIARAIWG